MIDSEGTAFTVERILQQAQVNINFILLGTITYLQNRQITSFELLESLGRQVAPLWESQVGNGARDVAHIAGLNLVSFGAVLQSITGDESKAEVVLTGWPPPNWLEFYQTTRSVADALWRVFEPIAAHLGLEFRWRRDDDTVTLSFSC